MDWLDSFFPVTSIATGALGVPVMLWRIYRWIDVRTRAQIELLETRLAEVEADRERLRQQRLTEVDIERANRMSAQDAAAQDRAQNIALTQQVRLLRGRLDDLGQLERPGADDELD